MRATGEAEPREPPAAAVIPRKVGRYLLYDAIARGGMATVHLGRLAGIAGFSRTVAIKRLHAQHAADPEFVAMFLDEARLVARVKHPNVVAVLDVIASQGELLIVMDYVEGESVARLWQSAVTAGVPIPLPIVSSIVVSMLQGLHAAHVATDDRGEPLGIVHRDVSPQNVLVSTNGAVQVIDFGVAHAAGRLAETRDNAIKGKLAYMAPEQANGEDVSATTDVFAAGVVLWELVTGLRLFWAPTEGATFANVMTKPAKPFAELRAEASALDAIVKKALSRDPHARYRTAERMAQEIGNAIRPASSAEVAAWVRQLAGEGLALRAKRLVEIESETSEPANNDKLMEALSKPSSRHLAAAKRIVVQGDAAFEATDPSGPPQMEVPETTVQESPSALRGRTPWKVIGVAASSVIVLAATAALVLSLRGGASSRQGDLRAEAKVENATGAGTAPSANIEPDPTPPNAPQTVAPPASVAGTGTPAKPAFRSRPPTSATSTKKTTRPDCTNPYRILPDGTRGYRRECLGTE